MSCEGAFGTNAACFYSLPCFPKNSVCKNPTVLGRDRSRWKRSDIRLCYKVPIPVRTKRPLP